MLLQPLRILRAALACASLAALAAHGAAPSAAPAPAPSPDVPAHYRQIIEATGAVVGVKVRAIANARSADTLGAERTGSGVVFAPQGLILTVGYLILEADDVQVSTAQGRNVPASVVAYDHATGFGLLKPLGPLDVKPIALGSSAKVDVLDRLLVASGAGEDNLSVATVVAKRAFAGYWEYLLDEAIFTSPPRADFGGAALINTEGQLVGIGSLFVMDAATPGERLPGNMFLPIDLLKPVLSEMIATGRQHGGRRPWLGVSSIEQDGRLKVLRVSTDGPAEKAGLEPGDIILGLDGTKVHTLPDFYRKLWAAGKPGTEVTLEVLKGTEVREFKVRSIDRIDMIRRRPTI
ncbi:MAG: S1C family serine protease [Betaproteobacteria bacterium]